MYYSVYSDLSYDQVIAVNSITSKQMCAYTDEHKISYAVVMRSTLVEIQVGGLP